MLAVLVLTGQTPAPLRHLEYSFTVRSEGLSGQEFNGIDNGSEDTSAQETAASGSGSMSVDVLAIAPDGALTIRISEWVKLDLRPRQAYTCTVYGNSAVLCPAVPAPSQAQWILLSYLGRSFVESAPWDAGHHWRRTESAGRYDLVEDFTMLPVSDAKRALIRESKTVEVHNGGFNKQHEDLTITYDRTMEIPDVIDDEFTSTGEHGDTGHATFEFRLTKDSWNPRIGNERDDSKR